MPLPIRIKSSGFNGFNEYFIRLSASSGLSPCHFDTVGEHSQPSHHPEFIGCMT